MTKLKIGIDMDGVVMDFVSAFKQEAETVLHKKFPAVNTDWDFKDWGITKEDSSKVWRRIRDTEDWFYLYLAALPGASACLPYLDQLHDLYFVTTRIETLGLSAKRQTQLSLYELGVEYPTVIVTKDKGAISRDLLLDMFIDDKPENLTNIHEASPKTKAFLREQAYNEDFDEPWVTRVASLDDFVKKVNAHNRSSK
jgi:5'(3')-deoxyribonucleotidase